ncbi:hypothetical protein [Actinokineospora enzanensis]|uniref:hypothetical protein n=1 Tax=Actinokineospora enzanensis TaxID=155975 RepID=UPI00039CDC9A|nr:hypothetical protein [Actinokineospora enzanensis]
MSGRANVVKVGLGVAAVVAMSLAGQPALADNGVIHTETTDTDGVIHAQATAIEYGTDATAIEYGLAAPAVLLANR